MVYRLLQILQTTVTGIPLISGPRTSTQHPYVYVAFGAPLFPQIARVQPAQLYPIWAAGFLGNICSYKPLEPRQGEPRLPNTAY